MKTRDLIVAAFRGLGRHRLHAGLNVIGVLAGVASVVLLIGVTHAIGKVSKTEAAGLGSNLVVVYPAGVSASGVQVGLGTASTLSSDDVRALGDPGQVPDAVAAVPTAGIRSNVSASQRM